MTSNLWTIVALDESIEIAHFSCGEEFFDAFLKRYALANQERGLCKVYVAIAVAHPKRALGYFTLSTSSIERVALPKKNTRGLPKYERYPTILLGMLGRDNSQKGTGLGDFLLVSALQIAKQTKTAGFLGVELLANNSRTAAWYAQYGFMPLQKRDDGKMMMFIHRDAIV